jgi:hypothetical protein
MQELIGKSHNWYMTDDGHGTQKAELKGCHDKQGR